MAAEIRLLGGSRAILISDETLKHLGMTDRIAAVLLEEEIAVPIVYTEIPTDSSLSTANKIAGICRKNDIDMIIGAGWRFCYRHSKGSAHDSVTEL